jgi:hypothetical protein
MSAEALNSVMVSSRDVTVSGSRTLSGSSDDCCEGAFVSIIRISFAMGSAGLWRRRKSYKKPSLGPEKTMQSKTDNPAARKNVIAKRSRDSFTVIYEAIFPFLFFYFRHFYRTCETVSSFYGKIKPKKVK